MSRLYNKILVFIAMNKGYLLVKDNRKTTFVHSFSVEQKAKLLPFLSLSLLVV